MRDRLREKLVDRDAIAAHEERALRPDRRRESGDAGMGLWRASALDFDRHEAPARPDHEIDLLAALAPVVERALARGSRVGQVRTDARLHQPTPYLAVVASLGEREPAARRHQRGIQDSRRGGVLVLDEIQKIPGWSETVKRLWDEDSRRRVPLKVLLLGSAPLLVARGLSESLAGRFELLHLPHWSFAEMRTAFGWSVDKFIFYGGYPGAAPLVAEPTRWARYILDALVETSISRDVLLLTRVDKPALLRRLFELACRYSGQVLSYTKMLGQLQDAGNTTTLAHYLDLLAAAGMVTGLPKYAGDAARSRGSSPKLPLCQQARRVPLLRNPLRTAQRGLVGARNPVRELRCLHDLLHERALAHLPRPRDHLHEAAWLGETGREQARVGALEGHCPQITQYAE